MIPTYRPLSASHHPTTLFTSWGVARTVVYVKRAAARSTRVTVHVLGET